ncbi:DUF3918 domain-containing protein [bacterium LRH843]|nr:DUF3918 domain-containing protein [bacterium LRH843]
MRKAVTSMVALGLGVAAYSLSNRRGKGKIESFMEPMSRMNLERFGKNRTWHMMKKRASKLIS